VALVRVLITAGNETTRMLIGSSLLRLLEHPDQLATVRADPGSWVAAAVEETLRHSGPAKGLLRLTTEEVDLAGVRIPNGDLVQVLYASANHDPARFDDAEGFDIFRRDVVAHLGFGKGVHHCLGAPLARLEVRIAIERIVERLRGLRLEKDWRPEWRPSPIAFGLVELPVEWEVEPATIKR
jgi:cytochrome P450